MTQTDDSERRTILIHDLPSLDGWQLQEDWLAVDARAKAAPCQGCFGCWLKTPGACVLKDSLQRIGAAIAHICGLDCETCDARIATLTDDDALREKTAKAWSEMNHAPITPEMINCEGCRVDGVKTPFCETLCPIRQCALGKGFTTCGDCPDLETCENVGAVHKSDPEAKKRLTGQHIEREEIR